MSNERVARTQMMGIKGLATGLLIALWVFSAAVAEAAGSSGFRLRVVYLARDYPEPLPLSLLEKPVPDKGLMGARLAIAESRHVGRFLGQEYELVEVVVPADGDVVAAARSRLVAGDRLFVANLEMADLLAVADVPEARDALIINIRARDDELRNEMCRSNLFHVVPSYAMLADALAQYLIWKKWRRWFVVHGVAEEDYKYLRALERASHRFGGKIVEKRAYEFRVGARRVESGHQQIQTQMPLATVGAPAHDVLWVVDLTEAFGLYLPYNTTDPRPVVGSFGLVAAAWHRSYEQYGSMTYHSQFEKLAGRPTTELDYLGWLGVRVFAEAALRTGRTDAESIRRYLLSDEFVIGTYKGVGSTFRRWNLQLRQPILLAWARALVSMSPQDEFLHQYDQLDTLGYDQPESRCRLDRTEER